MPERDAEFSMIAVAGTSREEIERALPYARVLARSSGASLALVGLIQVPEGQSLGEGAGEAQRLRRQLEPLREGGEDIKVRVAHDPWLEAGTVLAEIGASLAFFSWSDSLPTDLLHRLPCDGVVVNGDFPPSLKRILLPIRGGPFAALSLKVALAFAQVHNAEITLLHAAPPARFRDEGFREFFGHLQSLPEITRWVRVRGDPIKGILDNAQPDEHQLLIMGAIARPQKGDPAIGPTARRVIGETRIPALIVRTCPPAPDSPLAPPSPAVDYTISVVVDKWFAENTFAAHEFTDLKRLVEQKERQGLTISLGLPALNEEETIGKVIKTVRRAFMERYPLVDEIVVIDSNSTDKT
ncbi:MAG: glycosyltransferase, partial [Rudaea sp.]